LTDSLTASEACVTVSSTILELIQGPCEGNQNHFTFQTTLIEILNSLMRKSTSSNTNSQILLHEYETKKTGIKILQGLLEGQGKKHGIYDRILSVLHLDVIQILVCNPKNNEEEEQGLMKKQAEVTLLKSKSMSVDVSMGVSQSQQQHEDQAVKPSPDVDEKEENQEEILSIISSLSIESLVLLQILCDYKPTLRKELTKIFPVTISSSHPSYAVSSLTSSTNTTYSNEVCSVEIMWRGELQRRFFHIPKLSSHLTLSTKSTFIEFVNRSSHENKLLDLCHRTKIIYIELLHSQFISELKLNRIFSRENQNRATWITFTLACLINSLLLIYFNGEDCFKNYDENSPSTSTVICSDPILPNGPRAAVNILNSLQIVFSSFTLIMFLIIRAPVQYISSYQQGHGVIRSIIATALDPLTMYYFIYVILAIAAIKSDYILTFFLLDIVVKNSYAMDVMVAVFTPIKQLTVAICLSLIVMYIFAMFMVRSASSPPPPPLSLCLSLS
jgi:hypothetical protein